MHLITDDNPLVTLCGLPAAFYPTTTHLVETTCLTCRCRHERLQHERPKERGLEASSHSPWADIPVIISEILHHILRTRAPNAFLYLYGLAELLEKQPLTWWKRHREKSLSFWLEECRLYGTCRMNRLKPVEYHQAKSSLLYDE